MADPQAWGQFISTVGFPIACAAVLLFFLWSNHKNTSEQNNRLVESIGSANKAMADSLPKIANATESISERLNQVQGTQEDHTRDLNEIRNHMARK